MVKKYNGFCVHFSFTLNERFCFCFMHCTAMYLRFHIIFGNIVVSDYLSKIINVV